eukprot:TRINITY_DN7145_c0_g1_i1.p2 TRINITY_DN7145_c0_g1~~TRINITY_DN7145_c0_g1_i1.p2  ORF type:complete len:256 (+),score=53.67 TRINITY_DN7145_c0_g1_i1:1190-1957(+)
MVIIPGYCVYGTVGWKLLNGQLNQLEVDKKTVIDVKCKIRYLSFSAHADAKGIMQLIRQVEPRNVVLVHGEGSKMAFLKQRIIREFGIDCYDPATGCSITVKSSQKIPINLSTSILKRKLEDHTSIMGIPSAAITKAGLPMNGLMILNEGQAKLVEESEAAKDLGGSSNTVQYSHSFALRETFKSVEAIQKVLATRVKYASLQLISKQLSLQSVRIYLLESGKIVIEWQEQDDEMAMDVVSTIYEHCGLVEESLE